MLSPELSYLLVERSIIAVTRKDKPMFVRVRFRGSLPPLTVHSHDGVKKAALAGIAVIGGTGESHDDIVAALAHAAPAVGTPQSPQESYSLR